jgi:hypothetical protein
MEGIYLQVISAFTIVYHICNHLDMNTNA